MDQLRLNPPLPDSTPPVLIPLRTRNLSVEDGALLSWGGINMEGMLSLSSDSQSARLRSRVRGTPEHLRSAMRLGSEAKVISVLNGKDETLEALWPFETRSAVTSTLAGLGLSGVTGPTFSVYDEEPASHRVYMSMRHHKMVQELDRSGILAIPNLYWREGDPRDIAVWGDYLRHNPQVQWVSRDFSRDTNQSVIDRHLDGLARILRRAGRPLHVFALTGPAFGVRAIRRIGEEGSTFSIVTARPILAGVKGRSLIPRGDRVEERLLPSTARGSGLALENLRRVERLLSAAARGAGMEQQPQLVIDQGVPT